MTTGHEEQHVDEFDVVVENQDAGWAVITVADGVRSVINHHPDRESAEFAAQHIERGATRYDNAAAVVEPEPEKYPGDGS